MYQELLISDFFFPKILSAMISHCGCSTFICGFFYFCLFAVVLHSHLESFGRCVGSCALGPSIGPFPAGWESKWTHLCAHLIHGQGFFWGVASEWQPGCLRPHRGSFWTYKAALSTPAVFNNLCAPNRRLFSLGIDAFSRHKGVY